jgi:hypothetical protein
VCRGGVVWGFVPDARHFRGNIPLSVIVECINEFKKRREEKKNPNEMKSRK